jgi:hypothetical protein
LYLFLTHPALDCCLSYHFFFCCWKLTKPMLLLQMCFYCFITEHFGS